MSVRVSCPYCNTGFALPEVLPGGRAVCPRCGDAFPVRSGADEPAGTSPPPAALPLPAAPHPPRPAPRGIVLALVIVLGLLGIGVALLYFRDGSPPPPEPEPLPPAATTPPLELRGLGYLPADANLVFGIEPRSVAAYADRTREDPRGVLQQIGIPIPVFALLQRINLKVRGIDHVVGGAFVPDTDLSELRVAVAVVMRNPLADEGVTLRVLDAKPGGAGGKAYYKVTVAGLPLVMARPADTVLVFGWSEPDLEPAWAGGTSRPTPGVRELLGERLPPNAAAWAVAADARWADKKPVGFFAQQFGRKDWLPVLAKGRAAAVGVTFGSPPRVRVAVRCADTDTAGKLRAYFKEKATAPGATDNGNGEWATIDTPTDPQAVLAPLKGFLDDAARR